MSLLLLFEPAWIGSESTALGDMSGVASGSVGVSGYAASTLAAMVSSGFGGTTVFGTGSVTLQGCVTGGAAQALGDRSNGGLPWVTFNW